MSAADLFVQFDPDQARQNIEPDLDPKCFTLHGCIPAERCFEKLILKKSTLMTKNREKLLAMLSWLIYAPVLTTLTYKTINRFCGCRGWGGEGWSNFVNTFAVVTLNAIPMLMVYLQVFRC